MNSSIRTSNLAIASLVTGILGWTVLPWIAGWLGFNGHLG